MLFLLDDPFYWTPTLALIGSAPFAKVSQPEFLNPD